MSDALATERLLEIGRISRERDELQADRDRLRRERDEAREVCRDLTWFLRLIDPDSGDVDEASRLAELLEKVDALAWIEDIDAPEVPQPEEAT